MVRFAIAAITLVAYLGLSAETRARQPEHEAKDDARSQHNGHGRSGEHRRKTEAPAGSVTEAPPAPPSTANAPPAAAVAPAVQPAAVQLSEHLLQTQQLARQLHKQAETDPKSWNDSRTQRAESHRREITQSLGNVTDQPDARAELALHADRMARLNRALDLAERKVDTTLINLTIDLIAKEIARDATVLANIQAKAGNP